MPDKMDIISQAVNEDEINSGRADGADLTAIAFVLFPIAVGVACEAVTHPKETAIILSVIWSSLNPGQ